MFDINCPFVFSHLIFTAGYICKRTTLHNLLFTWISVLLHRLILYIKVFWNKLKYMWFRCLHRKIVPLRGHYHYWVCHLESRVGKSAIYYFPLDDSWHGCSINAWGPRYLFLEHLHIYFHCFENFFFQHLFHKITRSSKSEWKIALRMRKRGHKSSAPKMSMVDCGWEGLRSKQPIFYCLACVLSFHSIQERLFSLLLSQKWPDGNYVGLTDKETKSSNNFTPNQMVLFLPEKGMLLPVAGFWKSP